MSAEQAKQTTAVSKLQWILLFFCLVLLVVLLVKNHSLRQDYEAFTNANNRLQEGFEVQRDILLQLVNKKAPWGPSRNKFLFSEYDDSLDGNRYLMIVFNLTVCGQCLNEELALLKDFDAELTAAQITVLAVVGIGTESEKADVAQLRASGVLPYRLTLISDVEIAEVLNAKSSETTYLDTPVYFLTDTQSVVRNVFKPDSRDPRTLRRWLDEVVSERNVSE